MPANLEESKAFIEEPLDIKPGCELTKRDLLFNTKPEGEHKSDVNNFYESWIKSASHLVESKSYKLLPCRNQDDIFLCQYRFYQISFPYR